MRLFLNTSPSSQSTTPQPTPSYPPTPPPPPLSPPHSTSPPQRTSPPSPPTPENTTTRVKQSSQPQVHNHRSRLQNVKKTPLTRPVVVMTGPVAPPCEQRNVALNRAVFNILTLPLRQCCSVGAVRSGRVMKKKGIGMKMYFVVVFGGARDLG